MSHNNTKADISDTHTHTHVVTMTDKALPQNGARADEVHAVVLGFSTEGAGDAAGPPSIPSFDPVKKAEKGKKTLPGALPAGDGPLPPPAMEPRDFSTGICDFYQSWVICADAYCCSYCVASAQHNFLINEKEGIFLPLCCGLLCVDMGLTAISPYLPSSLCFHTCFMRHAIRQRYHLHHVTSGEPSSAGGETHSWESLTDFLSVCFCLACVIAQHQREIILQGDWCGGVFSNRHSMDSPGEVYAV